MGSLGKCVSSLSDSYRLILGVGRAEDSDDIAISGPAATLKAKKGKEVLEEV